MGKHYYQVDFKNPGPGTIKPAFVYADSATEAKAEGLAVWRNRNGSDAGFDWSTADQVVASVKRID